MSNVVTAKVEGLRELDRDLRALGPSLARGGLRAAVNAGAQVIKKAAQAFAPVLTGRLSRKAIYVRRAKELSNNYSQNYVVAVRTGTKHAKKDRDAYYWWFLEFGTRFMAAMPFMRPAFESKKTEAFQAIRDKLKDFIFKNAGKK